MIIATFNAPYLSLYGVIKRGFIMLLYELFAVLVWAAIISGKTPGGVVLCAAIHRDARAGIVAPGPGLFGVIISKYHAFIAVLRRVYIQRYNKPLFDIKRLKRANNRISAAYTTGAPLRAKRKKPHPRTGSGVVSVSGRKFSKINFMAFISLFQPQKPLGCVSFFQKSKIPKILDRGGF